MKNYNHMFVQIDTDKLILGLDVLAIGDSPEIEADNLVPSSLTKSCTTICSKGALSTGSPAKDFTIDVTAGETIHFTILPANLMTHHGLYIRGFENPQSLKKQKAGKTKSPFSKPRIGEHAISFSVDVKKTTKKNKVFSFSIWATLEYTDLQEKEHQMHLCIDPKIRVIQSGGH